MKFLERAANVNRRQFLQSSLLGASASMLGGESLATPIKSAIPAPFEPNALTNALDKAIANHAAPGIALSVWHKGAEVYSQQLGDKMMGSVDYGLGLLIDHDSTSDQSAIIHHHGGVVGFASMLVSHPNSGLTYACLCNADTNPQLPFRDLRRAILTSVLKPAPVKS